MIMSSEQLAAIFRQWLELSETYAFLGQFVRFKSQREENAAFLDSESPEDLRQGFLLFLVDRFVTPEKLSPDLMLLINTAQFRRILELAWGRFIWDLRERARNKKRNPRGYLYRRLREMLQRSQNRFAVIRFRRKYLYYYPKSSVPNHLWPDIKPQEDAPTDDVQLPPPPPICGQPADKYVFSAKWLLDTADFYWHQAMQGKPQPLALSIRSLSRYISDHHLWLNTPRCQEETDTENIADLTERKETMEECLLRLDGLRSVAPLAAQLVATWSIQQRQVFMWRLSDPPVTYEVIAKRLGIADHNKAYALFQKTVQSLRRFTGDWPGLPLSELPEEVAISFIEEMKRLCKNSPFCP
jgi:hypothetical protein